MAKTKTLTIGLAGAGETSKKNIVALLDDFAEAHKPDKIHAVLAVTNDWHKSHDAVLEWVEDNEGTFDVVHDQEAKKDKDLKAIIEDASSATQVTQVSRKVAAELEAVDEPRALLLLWDPAVDDLPEENAVEDPGYAAFEAAAERDVPVYDLCDGLERIHWDEDAEDGDDPVDEPEETAEGEARFGFPTREELGEMDRKDLKKLAEAEGLELSGRAHTSTYVDELAAHFEAKSAAAPAEDAPVSKDYAEEQVSIEIDEDAIAKRVANRVERALEGITSEVAQRITATDKTLVALDKKVAELVTLVENLKVSPPAPESSEEDERPARRSRRARADEDEEEAEEKPRTRRARRPRRG